MFYTFDNVIKLSQAFLTHFSYHKLTNTVEPGWLPPACQKECFQVDNLNENVMKVWIKPSTPDSQYYNYEVQSPFPVIKSLRETFWRPAVNALIAIGIVTNAQYVCYNVTLDNMLCTSDSRLNIALRCCDLSSPFICFTGLYLFLYCASRLISWLVQCGYFDLLLS